jgi:hypothetical protein
VTTPLPYTPRVPLQGGMRALYNSVAQVIRLTPTLGVNGAMTTTWAPLTAIVDSFINLPGLLACRLDLQFVRRGVDQPQPIVAGRAPDRVGVVFFDLATDQNNIPLILAGDRLVMQSGPIVGTFDLRVIPDVAQDYLGAHHVETQAVEVSMAMKPGTFTPFPGGAP